MGSIDWVDVRRRLAELAASPNASKVFGHAGHRFEVEPVLRPGELAELEGQIGVTLPEDYRDFLLNVGRGGAGPCYGVFPVERADGRWAWVGDGAVFNSLDRLAEPFPGRGPDESVLAALLAERPEEEDDPTEFDAAYEAWDERYAAVVFSKDLTVGAICICHEGCAYRDWLVVSGPERGNLWSDDRVDEKALYPCAGEGADRLTFGDWYLGWLADAERTAGIA